MAGLGSTFRKKYPRFLLVLVFTELWERFSYYSMRSLLVLYMSTQMNLDDQYSIGVYSLLSSIGYILPIIAGILADRLFGFRRLIFIGGAIITLGHFLMIFSIFTDFFFFWGIGCVGVGTGLFKGNITNLLGSSYDVHHNMDRLSGFTLFYAGINLGAFVSAFTSGYSSSYIGYHFAFSLAGVGMIIGLIIFSLNRKLYEDKDILKTDGFIDKKIFSFLTPSHLLILGSIAFTGPISALFYFAYEIAKVNIVLYIGIIVAIALIALIFRIKDTRERKNYLILLIYFVFTMIFFSFELQLGSLFTLFIQRNVYRYVLGIYIPTPVSSSFNPALIMTAGLILSNLKTKSSKYDDIRILFGVLTNTFCFLIMYWGTTVADPETSLTSMAFPFFGILVMALGEVIMIPLIQSSATKYAPKGFKGLMMGIYMGMLGFASLTGFIFADIFDIPGTGTDEGVDPHVSLPIYKTGFLDVGLYNIGSVVLFIFFIPVLYWLKKPTPNELESKINSNNVQIKVES